MKSFATLTMKSKQVRMKSSLRSDEIKSVFYPCGARFHHEVISSAVADLFRRKTDLTEKSTCILQVLFSGFHIHNRCNILMKNLLRKYKEHWICFYTVIMIAVRSIKKAKLNAENIPM